MRCAPTPGTSSAWTSRATASTGSGWRTPPTSTRSTTPASPSTAPPSCTSSCSPPRAASRSRRSPRRTPTPSSSCTSTRSTGSRRPRRREAAVEAKIPDKALDGVAAILVQLYECFVKGDCDLAEINPLILKPTGEVHALDAKVSLDNNASFRHPEWEEYSKTEVLDEREQLAKEKDLQYIGLDGTVGIIANGAGLAMSTLDVVNQVGGSAANFLDIGGGASADVMAAALDVINYDENVRSIFVNIFGGITRGEDVANGIVEGLSRVELRAPIVIRLDGTNAEEGRQIILDAGIPASKLISKPTMLEAAREAVRIAGGSEGGA